MIIAQISDTHIALDVPDADRRIRDFDTTIADINSLDSSPDLIIHTGDITHNGLPDEYACAADILAKAKAPVFLMVGNKDDRAHLPAAFPSHTYLRSDSGFIDYAIEDFCVQVIALDTLHTESNKGDFCEARAGRFSKMLDADTMKPIAVFTHHPPFEVQVGPEPMNFQSSEAMDRLCFMLRRSNRVRAIFSGHVHRGTDGKIDDIPALVMPSIATSLRWDDVPDTMKYRPVYYIHRFTADGSFTTEARIVEEH